MLFLSMTVSAGIAHGQKVREAFDADAAHVLKIVKTARELPSRIETDGAGKTTLSLSPDRGFKAFVLCVPPERAETQNCSGRVFLENTKTKDVYEVSGEELFVEIGRPVDELKWKNAYILSYERWSGPHYGRRYVINARTLKQTAAYILADR